MKRIFILFLRVLAGSSILQLNLALALASTPCAEIHADTELQLRQAGILAFEHFEGVAINHPHRVQLVGCVQGGSMQYVGGNSPRSGDQIAYEGTLLVEGGRRMILIFHVKRGSCEAGECNTIRVFELKTGFL